jgi:hypothetical protein
MIDQKQHRVLHVHQSLVHVNRGRKLTAWTIGSCRGSLQPILETTASSALIGKTYFDSDL